MSFITCNMLRCLIHSSSAVLVFGMCTFAGGLRWKEQWFDSGKLCYNAAVTTSNPTIGAAQIQSSLLSISTTAVLLPAGTCHHWLASTTILTSFLAFHFALRIDGDDNAINNTPETDPSAQLDFARQNIDILRMSHGVAIVLIISLSTLSSVASERLRLFCYSQYTRHTWCSNSTHTPTCTRTRQKGPRAVGSLLDRPTRFCRSLCDYLQ